MVAQTRLNASGGDLAAYTTLHLSANSFLYPPNPPDIRRCACKANATNEPVLDQEKLIRVYHTEPSVYAYNQGSFLVRENRYSTKKGWHAPNDDLVADDASFGTPVASLGWWVEGGQGDNNVYESKVYYVDNAGRLRERTNWTHFSPDFKDSFDSPLPDPGSLVPPVPGWKLTPLQEGESSNATQFPIVVPLSGSKLAAVRSEDSKIHIFYQASDNSIKDLVFVPGTGWVAEQLEVAAADVAKSGTPLTAVTGGWSETRLFYVKAADLLGAAFSNDHVSWTPADLPSFPISPSAMLTAVAWNFASPYFEIRIYSTDDKDELFEISYSRSSGGWAPLLHSVSVNNSGAFSPASRSGTPLSAVTAVVVDDSWVTKVYFHPRRVIGEWDLCTKVATYSGIPANTAEAVARRQTEQETRKKIREEEERRAEEERARKVREEAEQRAREEEEAARKAKQEEEARKAKEHELPNSVTLANPIAIVGSLQGATSRVDDEFYKLDLDFPVTLYGHSSSRLWITDNGMLCLDNNTNARAKRTGQPLPYHDGIPDYSIFPFWTDLLIVDGKPHGVYYEVTGQAPNRVLVVEWYVTRYSQEDQYFHFNVKLEEAKPGVVEFKYYDAVDKGAQCTIGVQGPSGEYIDMNWRTISDFRVADFLQFSYNEPKVTPGLQLVFDTNGRTVNASRFNV
ncbi:hypothetical protein HJFPF1_10589 [Paramyrothecium foliicola]|nr:hypothetical protein HJFPF1_10589 [Paramyrothecium foliicola]